VVSYAVSAWERDVEVSTVSGANREYGGGMIALAFLFAGGLFAGMVAMQSVGRGIAMKRIALDPEGAKKGAETTGKAVGKGTKKGAEATAKGAKKAGSATKKGAKTVGEKANPKNW